MYFWNTRELALKLKSREIDESDFFKYFIILWIFINSAILIPGDRLSVFDTISYIVHFIFVFACFKTNRKSDNQEFLGRFFALSFVLLIKVLPLIFIGELISLFIADVMSLEDGLKNLISDITLNSISILIDIRLLYWFRFIGIGSAKVSLED